jgi:uncharacterized protein YjiS (DUF1127 family)
MSRTLDLPRATPESGRSAGALCRAFGRLIARTVCNRVNAWMVRRTIESLHALDDRMLADIGLHRGEIEYVVRRQMARHW